MTETVLSRCFSNCNVLKVKFVFVLCIVIVFDKILALPIEDVRGPIVDYELETSETTTQSADLSNSSSSDLYLIRAVVYEIGVLTDADNSTNSTAERHEEVNISFYDPPHNGNSIALDGVSESNVITNTDAVTTLSEMEDLEENKLQSRRETPLAKAIKYLT